MQKINDHLLVVKNCTVTFSLGIAFNRAEYEWLARNGWNLEYDPRRFHAIIMRVRSERAGKATGLVFRSGRVVLTGLRHPNRSEYMAHKLATQIAKIGDGRFASRVGVHQLRVRNMVGSRGLNNNGCNNVRIDMHRLFREWRHQWTQLMEKQQQQAKIRIQFLDYDPSMFPALRSRLEVATMTTVETNGDKKEQTFRATCLIFRTGKCILTGPISLNQMNMLLDNVMNILINYIHK
jgi:TATA-box binding protein (TBP) (component of TFIID and TFIIIB)